MAHGAGFDDPAHLHQDLGRLQTALPVFVIDQRKPTPIGLSRLIAASGMEGIEYRRMPSGTPPPVMEPVAPASISGYKVMPSSPSQGPSMAALPRRIISRNFAAAWAISILRWRMLALSLARRTRNCAESSVPVTGASWIMTGMETAAETRASELTTLLLLLRHGKQTPISQNGRDCGRPGKSAALFLHITMARSRLPQPEV